MDKNIDLDDIIEGNVSIDNSNETSSNSDNIVNDGADDEIVPIDKRTKEDVVMDIIYGRVARYTNQDRNKKDIVLKSTIKASGTRLPEPEAGKRKVIVYCAYNEAINKFMKLFADKNVKFVKFGGTVSQRSEQARQFTSWDSGVILISGADCGGINLQTATDIIYTHKFIDSNTESQIAGRAIRSGRSNNLSVHYVLYDNEMQTMQFNS